MSILSKINSIPLTRLCLISICGGFATIGMVYFVRSQVAAQVEQRPFCKESLRMLRNHPGANHVFGKGFDVKAMRHRGFHEDYDSQGDLDTKTKFYFPVHGDDGKGSFIITGKCNHNYKSCQIEESYIQIMNTTKLEKEEYEDKKLIVYNREKHGPLPYELRNEVSNQ